MSIKMRDLLKESLKNKPRITEDDFWKVINEVDDIIYPKIKRYLESVKKPKTDLGWKILLEELATLYHFKY